MPIINNDTLYVGSVGLRVSEVNSIIGAGLDVGSLCVSNRINKWSKWKPFRSAAVGYGNASDQMRDMKNVNMGFIPLPTASVNSGHVTSEAWAYNKPRGISQNEWFRLLDFAPLGSTTQAPGYCHSAVCPLATWWPDSLNNKGRNRVILFADQQVNGSSSAWDADTCVSFLDCVDGSNNPEVDYGSYYFALLITDNSGGQNSNVLLSSGVTVDDLVEAPTKLIMFDFCAYEAPDAAKEGCVELPRYTFADSKIGHNFDIAWVLAPLSSGVTYVTSNFPTMISLNLENNINMQNMQLKRSDSIEGLVGHITGTLTPISSGGSYVTDTYRGNVYRLFRLDGLSVYLDTSNADWQVTNTTTGLLEDRTEVYVELVERIGVDGDSYIMTSPVNLTNYNSIRPSVVDPGQSGNRFYDTTDYNRLFDVPKGPTPAIATVALDDPSNIGEGTSLPFIYLWARTDQIQSSVAGLQLGGAAFGDRDRINPPFKGRGDRIPFDTEHLRP